MWHYQVIRYPEHIEIVEAFEEGRTENLFKDTFEDIDELKSTLTQMLEDIENYKPIDAQ